MEYPFILGTAGHIDHGKTALVKAMTGVDCDRLEEEKRRGITIELGFAPLTLRSGKTVSIVDVPGHERFIRQMASGAAGMDAAMLVIAASEGVMPQTREHLDILNILGVRFGLVALTKKDLVDDETLALAEAEATELIRGTCLEGAAILPVSSVTGEGVAGIIAEIETILANVPPRTWFGAFFLPVDRVFTKKGFGSVVTGTVYQGRIAEGDEVQIMPSGGTARVRSLQTHGTKTGSVTAGQRAAVNLSALSSGEELERGAAVCAKGAFVATDCMSVYLTALPSAREPITHWQRVRLLVGTSDVVARISLLRLDGGEKSGEKSGEKKGIPPGGGGPAQLLSEEPIPVAAGQRFVIRFYSPLLTIGGGRILLPNASLARGASEREARAALVESLADDFTPVSMLAALVRDRGVLSLSALFELSQMDKSDFTGVVTQLAHALESYGLVEFGKTRNFITTQAFDTVTRAARRILQAFHERCPELAGLDGEKLYASLDSARASGRVSPADFKDLLALMEARGAIARADAPGKTCYRLPDFTPAVDAKLMALAIRVKERLAAAGLNLLKPAELEASLGGSPAEIRRATAYLRERDELWTIVSPEGGLLLSRDVRERLIAALASIVASGGAITVGALRDAIGVNRKYALAMLDFLDSQGVTLRDGDTRVLAR